MEITKLVLSKYKRLLLRDLTYFEYTPTSMQQLIIGTNGSGKSSVMKELSPLPAHQNDFNKDGFKRIEFTHNDKVYVCESLFTHPIKHTFFENGVNINPGGTATVQKDLCEQLFGITPELFSIMIGKTKFSNMPSLKRRDWIIKLSGINLDYAMKIFNKVKGVVRDHTAVVKHLDKRISDEASKALTDTDIGKLTEACQTIKNELSQLLLASDNNVLDGSTATRALDGSICRLDNKCRELLNINTDSPKWYSGNSLDDILTAIATKRSQLASIASRLGEVHDEQLKLEELIRRLSAAGCIDGKSLTQVTDELIVKYDTHALAITTFKYDDSELPSPDGLYVELVELFGDMLSNHDRKYTKERRESQLNVQRDSKLERDRINVEIGKLEHRLSHTVNAVLTKCPKCAHSWNPLLGDEDVNTLTAKLQVLRNKVLQCDGFINEATEYLDELKIYQNQYGRYTQLVKSNPMYGCLWDAVNDGFINGMSPKSLVGLVGTWYRDTIIARELYAIRSEITANQKAIAYAAAVVDIGDNHYDNQLKQSLALLESLTTESENLTIQLQELKAYHAVISNVINSSTEVHRLIVAVDSCYKEAIAAIRKEHIDTLINERHISLAHSEACLSAAKALSDILTDLNTSKNNTVGDLRGYTAIMDELSPIDGLIADCLKMFLNCFVEEINSIVSQVWTYDMHVLECGKESGELDWKFPVMVNGCTPPVPDISETSSSQLDIIDLAFKLIVVTYLKLDNMPLYLDELAPSLDEQHRFNIMNFIKTLVESKRCGQLFMISHYVQGWGVFPKAEVCVMDTANMITLPEIYNQHVTMY